MSKIWARFKRFFDSDKSRQDNSNKGQEQTPVRQHQYDEVEIDTATPNGQEQYKVERKPRQYEDVTIDNDGDAPTQSPRSDNQQQLNYINVEFTGKAPSQPKMSLAESKSHSVTYTEVNVE